MTFPRAMNNQEKAGLKVVKESNLAYEIKFDYSIRMQKYIVNIPAICSTWDLDQVTEKNLSKDIKQWEIVNPKS